MAHIDHSRKFCDCSIYPLLPELGVLTAQMRTEIAVKSWDSGIWAGPGAPPHCPRASELTQEAEPQTVLLSSDWIFPFFQPNPTVSGRGFGWELQTHPFLWRGGALGRGPRKRERRVESPPRSKPQGLALLSLPLSSFPGVPTGPS